MVLDRPFQTVPVERQEMWALDGLLWTATVPLVVSAVDWDRGREQARESVWLLRQRGFGSVILTHTCGGAPDAQAAEVFDRFIGRRTSGRCFALWALPPLNASPAEGQRWLEAQADRVSRLPVPKLQPTRMPSR